MARLLIVDDNTVFAENLAEILGDLGNEVVIADSGDRALELAKGDHFDVLISDMRMPKMNGLELVRALRAIDGGLPAVVVTAYAADQDRAAMRAGIVEVLPKPVPISKLVEVVAKARRNGVVAIVDDDPVLVERVSALLRDHGFAPAVALASELPLLIELPLFAAVIGLQRSDDVKRALSAQFPVLPMVLLTEDVAPNATLRKPLDSGSLVAQLEQLHAQQVAAL